MTHPRVGKKGRSYSHRLDFMLFHFFLRARPTIAALLVSLFFVPVAARAALPTDALTNVTDTSSAPAAKDEKLTPESIGLLRTALQKEIDATRADLDQLPAEESNKTTLWLTQVIVLLDRLDGIYSEELRTLQHAEDLAKEAAEITSRMQNPRPPAVRLQPPLGLSLLDQLYAQRDYLKRARDLLKTDVANVNTALDDAQDALKSKDRLRRTAKESVAATPGSVTAQAVLRLAILESRVAAATVRLNQQALATLKLQQSLLEPKLALLLPDFDWLLAHLVLATPDLTAAEAKQAANIAALDIELTAARASADEAARLVAVAERRAATATTPDANIQAELESRRADRQTVNRMLDALTSQHERQAAFAEVLRHRRSALVGAETSTDLKTSAETNLAAIERLTKERRPLLAELRKSRDELQRLQSTLADTTAPARSQAWVADRAKHLNTWITVNERNLADLDQLTTVRDRLKEELSRHVSTFSWSDTLAAAKTGFVSTWDYEVFSIADQPIRVKTILAAIALILVGHWLSRRASILVGRAVFYRFGMNPGRLAAWQTLSFYAFFLIVLLTVTNLFHLSLTQFSVISGALAVGIGFGSQNLIGNFISGIILLIERPINQGDVIEINGQQMTVEHVGPRSTLVRSRDNTNVIVPNSRLLEENVVNLTLSDDVIRTRIKVGVAYGSPTRDVVRLLSEVMVAQDQVKKDPAPFVTFTDFGDSALIFEASFWSALEGRRDLESELRHCIADVLAHAGIQMAFPQRDVHLQSIKPLQVEILSANTQAPPETV